MYPLKPAFFSIPKFSPEDVPHTAPGNGKSFIDLHDLTLELKCDEITFEDDTVAAAEKCTNTQIELLTFRVPDHTPNWLDYWPSESLCCTAEVEAKELCTSDQLGQLIIPYQIPEILRTSITISKDSTVSLREIPLVHSQIKDTGVYILLFGICSPFTSPLLLKGTIDSMDPYGYLPADQYGNLPFYFILSIVYTTVGVAWLYLCVQHQSEIIPMQYWITLIIALGMLECAILYDHFLYWNEHGSADGAKGIELVGILFGVCKRTASRVFILMVALGYGVVKSSLGEDGKTIWVIGGCYALFSFIYDISSSTSPASHQVSPEDTDFSAVVVIGQWR